MGDRLAPPAIGCQPFAELPGRGIAFCRFFGQRAVEDFQTSPSAEEALYILSLSYERLDMPELAASARRVLEQSFPGSRFLTDGLRAPDQPWWRVW